MKNLIILITFIIYVATNFIKRETLEVIKILADWEYYEIDENPFRNHSHYEINRLLGTEIKNTSTLLDISYNCKVNAPTSFDSRIKWPGCVFRVSDQGSCGSCWAFAAATTLSDRLCIATNSSTRVALSVQNLVSCDNNNGGCNGGAIETAWSYLETNGTVSDQCFPYVSQSGKSPLCPSSLCINKTISNKPYKAIRGSSRSFSGYNNIQNEMLINGPLESAFAVYEDFFHYSGGIYKHVYGSFAGGHAIKVVGWGVLPSTSGNINYWIVQNSWGSQWGEQGYFRIAWGECYIDENFYGGLALIK